MKNNTLGLNSNVIAAILTIADNLRNNYKAAGVTNYQMPRNPFPAQKLVINALPTAKGKALTVSQIEKEISGFGYTVSRAYILAVLSKLRTSGAVRYVGTGHAKRYWFGL